MACLLKCNQVFDLKTHCFEKKQDQCLVLSKVDRQTRLYVKNIIQSIVQRIVSLAVLNLSVNHAF